MPASIRRVVEADSINVELPALPEAKMEMRKEMRPSTCKGVTVRILAERKQRVKNAKRDRDDQLSQLSDRELVAGECKPVEIANDGRCEALGLKKFASDGLDFFDGHAFEHGDQLLRREMAIEIDVIAREAGHALPRCLRAPVE